MPDALSMMKCFGVESSQEEEQVTGKRNQLVFPLSKKPEDPNNKKCIENIQDVFQEAVTDTRRVKNSNDPLQVSVHVFWELKEFMHQEFSADERLSSVLTITGSETDAQAATCHEYIGENWPRGLHLLKVVEDSIADGERFRKFTRWLLSRRRADVSRIHQ